MQNILTGFEIKVITLYQSIRRRFSAVSCCRHYPTCSQYAIDSLLKYGVIKGNIRTFGRVLKCNQFFPGGFDPA